VAHEILELAPEPDAALEAIRAASRTRPVLVLKKSPICPLSDWAERELRAWLETSSADGVAVALVDVLGERRLARGLTERLGIRHESPQGLWFEAGELVWHGSHRDLTAERYEGLRGSQAAS